MRVGNGGIDNISRFLFLALNFKRRISGQYFCIIVLGRHRKMSRTEHCRWALQRATFHSVVLLEWFAASCCWIQESQSQRWKTTLQIIHEIYVSNKDKWTRLITMLWKNNAPSMHRPQKKILCSNLKLRISSREENRISLLTARQSNIDFGISSVVWT